MSLPRTTVAGDASVSGVGLFTARPATATIRPADDGLHFRRTDLPGSPVIPIRIDNAVELPGLPPGMQARNTTLAAPGAHGMPGAFMATTEHILSALAAAGITDALIDVDGPEIPIADGSARPFAEAIAAAGRRPFAESYDRPRLARAITVTAGPASITATPHDLPTCRLEYRLDYGPGAALAAQSAAIELGENGAPARYLHEVAPARTYCLAAEARAMRAMGLFGHITTREMLVIGDDGRPVDQEWRLPDEPARHKLLDLIGDLYLAGPLPRATIIAHRSGHAMNQAMAREIVRARLH
ncbi:MAG: UDP-3-O-acyl-N-acetylglucosamine deacetylase [Phycisphaerales bacterium]|nr:UDP-3-O-acyl-N-acetylglucosamine deacetylase [Phycisphaerales bacterium]